MCARRFLAMVFILTLLFVAGAFAIFQWGGNVIIRQATPKGHFRAAAAGSAPDYAKLDSWAARPDIANDPSEWLPASLDPVTMAPGAAVFYVHPTTYLDRDRWNAPLAGNIESDRRVDLFVRSQASAFTKAGTVWAPRYRQAAFGAFLLKSDDAQKALDLAYRDVRAAFAQFFEEVGDRPIILAGHSQGALHLSRLLVDEADRLKGRLVAAYVVGWPLSTTADLPAIGHPACKKREQAGCVLSWQSFAEPANPNLVLDAWTGTEGLAGARRERKDMLCVNPLTGSEGGRAPARDNPGTLVPSADLSAGSLAPGLVGARCERGFLVLDGAVPALGPYVLPGNNYHVYDYALFWSAIRDDAVERLGAWTNAR